MRIRRGDLELLLAPERRDMIRLPMPMASPTAEEVMPKLWAKSLGERGHRVRLYEPRSGGNLMRSVYLHGKEDRKSLGHRDKKKAVADGIRLLAQLQADSEALNRGTLTLGALIERYKANPAFAEKKESSRERDNTNLALILQFFGAALDVWTLGPSDVTRYVQAEGRAIPSRERQAGQGTGRDDPVGPGGAEDGAQLGRHGAGREGPPTSEGTPASRYRAAAREEPASSDHDR